MYHEVHTDSIAEMCLLKHYINVPIFQTQMFKRPINTNELMRDRRKTYKQQFKCPERVLFTKCTCKRENYSRRKQYKHQLTKKARSSIIFTKTTKIQQHILTMSLFCKWPASSKGNNFDLNEHYNCVGALCRVRHFTNVLSYSFYIYS